MTRGERLLSGRVCESDWEVFCAIRLAEYRGDHSKLVRMEKPWWSLCAIQLAMLPSGQCGRLVALERTPLTMRQRRGAELQPKRPPGSSLLYQTTATRSIYLRQKRRASPVQPRRERAAASLRERLAAPARNSPPRPYASQSLWCAHSPNKKSTRKSRARQVTARTPQIQTVVLPEIGEARFLCRPTPAAFENP